MSTRILAAVAALATFVSGASLSAVPASADHHARAQPMQITVKCARYISRAVIWDRAMPIFLDDLRAAGYTFEEADAIGSRVCRDEAGVGNAAVLRDTMLNILRTSPPRGGR
ncbi:hypothetical protein SAMN05444004_10251 [Jannaschia faecimaris]|uniref:HdeA/HdeB family protein n=1 Tax=Jannaschia faecimaris TaxID=1244108 RepID=A0A1H3L1H9_9RHOB|nr:hypothetical protein [Jannaschia faecimaris]SDY58089.1 hypothetical protein SAMN05444004_10251 [Jannaschia faecimaris]